MSSGITRDEWIKAIDEAEQREIPESDALTITELMVLLKLGRAATDRRVKRLIELGKAEATTKMRRRGKVGLYEVPAYRLLP